MKSLSDLENVSALMEQISLFHPVNNKKQFSPEKTSFSPQTRPHKSDLK